MLYWALIFLVVALIAGLFGFGGVASASVGIAQILFVLFLILAAVAFVVQLVRGADLTWLISETGRPLVCPFLFGPRRLLRVVRQKNQEQPPGRCVGSVNVNENERKTI